MASQEKSRDTHKTLHDCRGRKRTMTSEQINDGASTPTTRTIEVTVPRQKWEKVAFVFTKTIEGKTNSRAILLCANTEPCAPKGDFESRETRSGFGNGGWLESHPGGRDQLRPLHERS
ncbi:hypothetical protein EVAR_101996_1 [Eumeta japonica]|uniref:Uncharacterized protein n=1 Tax=Eumeta variegata TaxID=151549 RepID=A0A4C1TSJ0_EUMVA|nr:hypothetical protein EVAR_101996_1 [Eumeta japonica]